MLRFDGTAISITESDTTRVGYSFGYTDPYYLQNHEYGPFCDVYSLGLVLLQMLTARPFFGERVRGDVVP